MLTKEPTVRNLLLTFQSFQVVADLYQQYEV